MAQIIGFAEIPFWDVVDASGVAPGYTGPLTSSNPWDVVVLRGQALPGIWDVAGRLVRKVDPKRKPGANGENPTVHGQDAAPIELRGEIWTAQQWAEMVKQLRVLWPPPGRSSVHDRATPAKGPTPFDAYHPKLALFYIASLLIVEIEAPKRNAKGGVDLVIKCKEYRPSKGKSVSVTPSRSIQRTIGRDANYSPPPAVAQPGINYSPANAVQSPPSQDLNYTAP